MKNRIDNELSPEIREQISNRFATIEFNLNRILKLYCILRFVFGLVYYFFLTKQSHRINYNSKQEFSLLLLFQVPLLSAYIAGFTPFFKHKLYKYFAVTCNLISNFLFWSFMFLDRAFLVFFIIPMVIAAIYGNKRFLLYVCILNMIAIYFAVMLAKKYHIMSDLISWTFVEMTKEGNLVLTDKLIDSNTILRTLLPISTINIILALGCYLATVINIKFIKDAVIKNYNINNYEKDLSFAAQIQQGVLLTEFPERKDVEVYAEAESAKIVGGDFYDFIEIDENHLAIVIGDVSGKGLPAAMFMMNLKSIISIYAKDGYSPKQIFEKANQTICNENKLKLHATVWLGILNTETGELRFVNAGHNPPLIGNLNSENRVEYNFLKTKPNFILGRKKAISYDEHSIQLKKGDEVFLYTDGLNEASNNSEQFGYERVLQTLNEDKSQTVKEQIEYIFEQVRNFEMGNHYDDTSLLALKILELKKPDYVTSITLKAEKENHEKLMEFIETELSRNNISPKLVFSFQTCVSELYSNVDLYGKPAGNNSEKMITLQIKISEKSVKFIFEDNCVAFNPFSVNKPEIYTETGHRKKGGLGIHLVKTMMDNFDYQYDSGNRTIFKKNF